MLGIILEVDGKSFMTESDRRQVTRGKGVWMKREKQRERERQKARKGR